MPAFTPEMLTYAMMAASNVESIPPAEAAHQLTTECPDCGQVIDPAAPGEHLVLDTSNSEGLDMDFVILVTCQGRFMLNPARVGLQIPEWTPHDGSEFWDGKGIDPFLGRV